MMGEHVFTRSIKSRGAPTTLFWRYVLIFLAVVFLTVLYLWEQTQVVRFDSRLRGLRREIETVEDENKRLFIDVISMSKGYEITERAEKELNMKYPSEKPVIVVVKEYSEQADQHRFHGIPQDLAYAGEK